MTPVLVFADDWGRHPSSCQHLVRHLPADTNVWWVNTIGTRPLRLDGYSIRRAAGKIREWILPSKPRVAEVGTIPSSELATELTTDRQPTVLKPAMWPSFRTKWSRAVNRRLLRRAIAKSGVLDGEDKPVVLTTLPIVADLVGAFPTQKWIYYCVDDFSLWPGLDGETLGAMERELVPKMDAVAAVSERLCERLQAMGADPMLLTHGVDLTHFGRHDAGVKASNVDKFLLGLEPPFVLFWGVVDERLDFAWLKELNQRMSVGSIVLVGPNDHADRRLATLDRVSLPGPASYDDLPTLARRAAVLVMPYADLPVTRAMQPLKLKEYLATGVPVVVRRLPATAAWSDACDVVDSAEHFVAAVESRFNRSVPNSQIAARGRLENESWQAKAAELQTLWRPTTT